MHLELFCIIATKGVESRCCAFYHPRSNLSSIKSGRLFARSLIVASDAELTNRQILSLVNLTKRFDVAVRLFSNRSPI